MTSNIAHLPTKRRPVWTWADRVRKVRRELGLTQAEFAELTGIHDKTIGAWESGKNTPKHLPDVAEQLERTTGFDRAWWIGWADTPFPDDPSLIPGHTTNPCLSVITTRAKISHRRERATGDKLKPAA